MLRRIRGGSILTKTELDETRRISKLCCNNPNVIKYIKKIMKLVVQLVEEFAIYYKKDVDNEILNRLHQFNKNSLGQVKDLNAVKEVIREGNLREIMILIKNFGLNGCDIVIWAIITKNHLLSTTFINQQAKRLKILTGLDVLDLQNLLKCKRGYGNCSTLENTFCSFSLLNQDGAVILSRYSENPIINVVRMKRPEMVQIDNLNVLIKTNPNLAIKYQKIIDESVIEYVRQKVEATHHHIAMLLKKLYNNNYVASVNNKNTEWYLYDDIKNMWVLYQPKGSLKTIRNLTWMVLLFRIQ